MGEKIGSGSFARVFKARCAGFPDPVAVKLLHIENESEAMAMRMLSHEIRVLANLAHPNVVRLLGVCVEPDHLSIVTEYAARRSLRSVLNLAHPNSGSAGAGAGASAGAVRGLPVPALALPVWRRFHILRGTVRAMHRLHSADPPVLHRDLKTGNLLVTESWECKVADFGMSTGLATISKSKLKQGGGTIAYEAPEMLDCDEDDDGADPYTTKADVYSFGIIVWETVTGQVPWAGKTIKQICKSVCLREARPQLPADGGDGADGGCADGACPAFLKAVMEDCWAAVPGRSALVRRAHGSL